MFDIVSLSTMSKRINICIIYRPFNFLQLSVSIHLIFTVVYFDAASQHTEQPPVNARLYTPPQTTRGLYEIIYGPERSANHSYATVKPAAHWEPVSALGCGIVTPISHYTLYTVRIALYTVAGRDDIQCVYSTSSLCRNIYILHLALYQLI